MSGWTDPGSRIWNLRIRLRDLICSCFQLQNDPHPDRSFLDDEPVFITAFYLAIASTLFSSKEATLPPVEPDLIFFD